MCIRDRLVDTTAVEPFRYKIYAGHFRYRLAVAVGALLLLVALSMSCSSAPELRGGAGDSKAEVTRHTATSDLA